MAEAAEIPEDHLGLSDSAYNEVTMSLVKGVLSKCTTCIRDDLDPRLVIDVFEEESTFGDVTRVKVGNLREQRTTADTNRLIHDEFVKNPNLYDKFKRALVRSGQTVLLRRLEVTEKQEHAKQTVDFHGCACADGGSSCTILERLKCPTDLPPVEWSPQKESLVRGVLRECTACIRDYLKPDQVIDVFEEENTFGDVTRAKVIYLREQKTTANTNLQIRGEFETNPNLYVSFKRALARSGHTGLLEILEVTEKQVHAEQIGDVHGCTCTDGGSSCILESLKCPTDLPPVESSKQKDLRRELVDLYKEETVRIPIDVLKPYMKLPVQSLYVKQHLRRIDPRGKSEHDKQSQSDDKPIDNVTDILFKDGKVCKDVFVSAEAGLGKSSLCAHLVRLWCDAHSQKKDNALTASGGERDTIISSNDPNVEHDLQGNGSSALTAPGSGHDTNAAPNDLKAMKDFKLLFYINLRDVDLPDNPYDPDCDEISALIYKQHQLKDTDYSKEYIVKQCMFDKSTLVVMDSLDECQTKRLPYRGKHNQSCIVTTSRPWKLESLRSQLEEKHGHQQVEIVGLEKASPKFLVENIVKILNKEMLEEEDKKKDGSQFLAEIEKEGLQDFLYFPMLIIQMLMLWFNGKPFGRSQSEIYSNVVHHQIEVAMRNKTLPEYEGKSKEEFPLFCDAESSCACKNYGELLWKVAALAFGMLFQENRAKCLVVDSAKKSFKDLTEEEVDVCLKVGLLSEHKLFAKKLTGVGRKSVTFPHKTSQEYCAAVYLSHRWSETVNSHIHSVIKDLDRAMELDKVLLFCSQLNPEVARELSGLIAERADGDARVQEYRESGKHGDDITDSPPNIDFIYKIQNIISAAQQQTIKVSSPQTTPKSPSQQHTEATAPITQCGSRSTPQLIMADIILYKSEWRRTEKDRIVNVAALDMAAVKSVHADAETADVTIWEMLKKQTRCLQTFVVRDNEDSKINLELIHGVVMRNQATLRTLGLHGDYYQHLDLSPLGNKLADMLTCDLTCLLLDKVDISHEQCETLVRHLSTMDNLRQLALLFMTFSHEQCETLGRHLSTRQNLRQLTLEEIECQTHRWWSRACCDVKLQSKLEHFKLDRLPFKQISFPADDLKTCEIRDNVPAAASAISCLTSASNLREFKCVRLRDVAAVRELATVLPRLHGLQRLDLGSIDFGCLREIRLSVAAAKTLESVELLGSTITAEGLESLVQSVDAPRVVIWLGGVTIRDGDPRDFLQRLRDSPSTEVRGDMGVEYKDGEWKVEWFQFYKNK